jgi:hypothetical protein
MSRQPLHRLATAFIVVLTLLFAQLAMARYVCPGQGGARPMTERMAAGLPCPGMDNAAEGAGLDPDQPALCHEHCKGDVQSFEASKLPAATLPALIRMLQLPPVLDTGAAVAAPLAATPEARPPPDPLFLSTLRLRV